FLLSAPKENGSCTPKEKALWRITEGAEIASRRAKRELSVRYTSLPLLPPLRNCIRLSHGAFGISNLWLQQAAVWLLCSSVWIASAAAALGVESMQSSLAGDRRMHQRTIGDFSFGHPKPFSFCKKKEKRVWETVSFLMGDSNGQSAFRRMYLRFFAAVFRTIGAAAAAAAPAAPDGADRKKDPHGEQDETQNGDPHRQSTCSSW
ncbi:MAG: hypothetical protein IKC04_01740, partial [Oscillospiraceae bacterium]|nr:hypothetical protein [Oscillospiraceae bacterium]